MNLGTLESAVCNVVDDCFVGACDEEVVWYISVSLAPGQKCYVITYLHQGILPTRNT